MKGTNASTDVGGTTVTVDSGTNISGIAVDGSAWIQVLDATAGHRNFAKITGSAGSGGATPNFTVAEAFTGSLSGKTWAANQTLASLHGANSLRLVDNNVGSGDAMPGWVMEMQSAHAESISVAIDLHRAGDTTSGNITIRGATGAGTLPKITITAGVNGFVVRATNWRLSNFGIEAAAGVNQAIVGTATGNLMVDGIRLTRTASNTFTAGIVLSSTASAPSSAVIGCDLFACATGIVAGQNTKILSNYIHGGSGDGINNSVTGQSSGLFIFGNIINGQGGDGIDITQGRTDDYASVHIACNTIYNCTLNGIVYSGDNAALGAVTIVNNILSNNSAYGIKLADSETLINLNSRGITVQGNNTFSNASGAYLPAGFGLNDPGLDPQFANPGSHDFSIGTNLKAKGFPVAGTQFVGTYSATYSYADPGAAQRQEAGAAGGKSHIISG